MFEWNDYFRRRSPIPPLLPAALFESSLVLMRPRGLTLWNHADNTLAECSIADDLSSVRVSSGGVIATVGERSTTFLDQDLRELHVLSGEGHPAPNQNGLYGFTVDHFWFVRRLGDRVELVALRVDDWMVDATHPLQSAWLRAPLAIFDAGSGIAYVETAQEGLIATASVVDGAIQTKELPFTGILLGFLAGYSQYACYWNGGVTISSLPEGGALRTFPVQRLTPITVPEVFTLIAGRRAATVESSEKMFSDVFLDSRGEPPPFPIWTGTVDGQTIVAVHEDNTLRLWRRAEETAYRG